MMWSIKVKAEGVYFTTFRKPTSTSLITTYSVPPFTTIRGMISNALGLPRDDFRVQDWIKIGIKPLRLPEKSREMAKILKLKGKSDKFKRTFSSSPMFKEFLTRPSYEIFLGGERKKIEKIKKAMEHPARPLYIGGSDSLVDINVGNLIKAESVRASAVSGITEGLHEDAFVEKIPYKFHKRGRRYSLDYKVISIPKNGSIHVKELIECFRIDDEQICLI